MTDNEIADKLELYNKWRRGEGGFSKPGCKPPMEPGELGLVIDAAIVRLRMRQGRKARC